jgi:hypothetical protein
VRDQFAVELASCARDFQGALDFQFDMIFVGSLFTHLNERMFRDALNYLIGSLSPGGLPIMTTPRATCRDLGGIGTAQAGQIPAAEIASRHAEAKAEAGRYRGCSGGD